VKVKDLMTTNVVAVGTDTPLKDVADILSEFRISGLPVVSERGTVLGVVSENDILVKARGTEPLRGLVGRLLAGDAVELEAKLAARTAGEAMTSPAVTITPDRPVSAAAGEMVERRINRLPVVDEDGKLVGIVTRADLVKAFARSDEEIVREIREDVMARALWLDPSGIDVSCKRGEVTLKGDLETRIEAEALAALAERVPGVVSVTSELTYRDPERSGSRLLAGN
jgi:CBS domain-containing protein